MSTRLYLGDPYLTRFEAEVTGRRTLGGRTAVVLSRTAFYPEGGGQPADRGTLSGARVVDVQAEGEEVLHVVESAIPDGHVQGEVDWERRFDHMQQHHGQHLLSAAFAKVLGAATVSFHLGEETCTIDLSCPLSKLDASALRAVEAACNTSIWRDLEVIARDFTAEERARLPLRKEAVKGDRVVLVEGVDASPCGGTHPRRTGEVGAVAVLRAQRWQDDVSRVEFICGRRVVAALGVANARLGEIGQVLKCSAAEAPQIVARMNAELATRRKELERLAVALAQRTAQDLAAKAAGKVVATVVTPEAGAALSYLKAAGAELVGRGLTALLGAVEDGRAHVYFARPGGDGPRMDALLKEAVQRLGGKGGGNAQVAQGSGPGTDALAGVLEWAAGQVSAPIAAS